MRKEKKPKEINEKKKKKTFHTLFLSLHLNKTKKIEMSKE
jgi:hypothetical protein